MAKFNAIGWFDIYVNDMNRAVLFYESVLKHKLAPMGDPTGETRMMGFPTDMGVYGAGGALVKSNHARDGSFRYEQPGLFGLLPFVSYGFKF